MEALVTRMEALLERVEALVVKAEQLLAPSVIADGPIDWGAGIEAATRETSGVLQHVPAGAFPSVLHVRHSPKVAGEYIGPPRAGKAKREPRNRDETPAFVEFYEQAYPRRVARDDAWRAWRKAVPVAGKLLVAKHARADVSDRDAEALLLNRAEQWAKHWRDAGKDKEFIPYPASWLNAGTWKDAPEVNRG